MFVIYFNFQSQVAENNQTMCSFTLKMALDKNLIKKYLLI